MPVNSRIQLMSTIAGTWIVAPAADFWEVEPNSLALTSCVVLALLSLFLCGLGLSIAATSLRLSTARVGILAVGELLALSIVEIAAVRIFWASETFKYLLFRQTVGWGCAFLIVVISVGIFLLRSRRNLRLNQQREPTSRLRIAFTILAGLVVSVAIAYGFARLRTYAPSDAVFRTARTAESVFIIGLPTLLLTALVVAIFPLENRIVRR